MRRSLLNKKWKLTATAAAIALAWGANASMAEHASFHNKENEALEWGFFTPRAVKPRLFRAGI